jgi:hypothetical protein
MDSRQSSEARPLLEENESSQQHGRTNGQGSSSSSNGWFSLLQPRQRSASTTSRHVTFAASDVDDEESQAAWGTGSLKGGRRYWLPQIAIYILLLLLGALIGGSLVRLLFKPRAEGESKGPLVPPVWTLPPVSIQQLSPLASEVCVP